MGFQVLAAARSAQAGKSIHEIINCINDVRSRCRVVAMLDTLKYVQHSGRVSWAKARLANFLNLRSLIELGNGEVYSLGEARTRLKGIERLGAILTETGPLQNLVILHTNAKLDAERFKEQHKNQSKEQVWICNVTTVIGTHVGPNALGFTAIKEK